MELALLGEKRENGETGTLATDTYRAAYAPQPHRRAGADVFEGPGDLDNVEHIYTKVVETGGAGMAFDQNMPNHIGIQFVDLKDRRHPSARDVETLRRRVKSLAGARITVDEQKEGPPTGAPINIEISGDDFRVLGSLAASIREVVEQIPFVEDVRDDYVAGIPSIQVRIDRQKAALFGLTTGDIGFSLKTAYNGLEVSTYREGDEDYDITVKLPETDRTVTDVLHKLMIPTPSGQLVPLTTLASIQYAGSMGDIVRVNHERVVTVRANVDETRIPGAVARVQAEKLLAAHPLPAGYRIKFTGGKRTSAGVPGLFVPRLSGGGVPYLFDPGDAFQLRGPAVDHSGLGGSFPGRGVFWA